MKLHGLRLGVVGGQKPCNSNQKNVDFEKAHTPGSVPDGLGFSRELMHGAD